MPNVPPLRFPEFTGEWERIRVSDLLDFYTTNSLSWDQLEYENTNILNLHYGLIHVGLPTLIDVHYNKLPNIKQNNLPNSYELCQEGDVAFADASEDTNEVAKVVEFFNLDGKQVVCGLHTIHGRDNSGKTIKGFKGYALSSQPFHFQIRRLAQGTKIYSISSKNFGESFISLPSKTEQKKIVALLSLLDQRIATQIRVIDKLESLIKGISKKLLAKQGNTYIKDCLICNSSTLQETNVSVSGKYPAWGATGISGYIETPQVEQDAILIIKDGASVGNVRYVSGKFGVIGTLNYLTAKNGYNLKYLYFCLCIFNFTPFITGLAIPHIYFRDYGNAQIYCPDITYQKRIAENLSNIERKIEIEKQILDKLKEQKNYLLSQMFI